MPAYTHIPITELKNLIKARMGVSRLELTNSILKTPLPSIAYISFDGDLWSHSELMKQYSLKKNYVPLHPEAALGTYLVTNHYKGDKGPIIEDCLSLINMVDEFFVMSSVIPDNEAGIKNLPEGVIAEIIYWLNNRRKDITYINTSDYITQKQITHSNNTINTLNVSQREDIIDILNNTHLRPVAYLLSGEIHAKHTDWMRQDAYDQSRVPLSPYTVLNYSTLEIAYPSDKSLQLSSRIALALKSDEIRLYGAKDKEEFNVSDLPNDAILELYLIKKLDNKKLVLYKSFADIEVPKYINRRKWAITEHEKGQTE